MASVNLRRTIRPSPSLYARTVLPVSRPASARIPNGISTRPLASMVTCAGSRIMTRVSHAVQCRGTPRGGVRSGSSRGFEIYVPQVPVPPIRVDAMLVDAPGPGLAGAPRRWWARFASAGQASVHDEDGGRL